MAKPTLGKGKAPSKAAKKKFAVQQEKDKEVDRKMQAAAKKKRKY